MPITDSLSAALTALNVGATVALPNPAPLTYVVVAKEPQAVNRAKRRPADQHVAVWITADALWTELAAFLLLDRALAEAARQLLVEERVTLLVPVKGGSCPRWLAPAVDEGYALLFGAQWDPLRDLLYQVGVLYVSSANLTGHPPAATADEVAAAMGSDLAVLELQDPNVSTERRATTTVRIEHDGALAIIRLGAQDHAHGGPAAYINYLRSRYERRRCSPDNSRQP